MHVVLHKRIGLILHGLDRILLVLSVLNELYSAFLNVTSRSGQHTSRNLTFSLLYKLFVSLVFLYKKTVTQQQPTVLHFSTDDVSTSNSTSRPMLCSILMSFCVQKARTCIHSIRKRACPILRKYDISRPIISRVLFAKQNLVHELNCFHVLEQSLDSSRIANWN